MTGSYQVMMGVAAGARTVALTDTTIRSVVLGTATAQAIFRNDGRLSGTTNNNSIVDIYNWLLSGAASAYDVQAVYVSGTAISTGPTGWVNLATSRTWTMQRVAAGLSSGYYRYEIRPAGGGSVITSAEFHFQATNST